MSKSTNRRASSAENVERIKRPSTLRYRALIDTLTSADRELEDGDSHSLGTSIHGVTGSYSISP